MTASDPVRRAPHQASSADSVEAAIEDFLDRLSRPCRILIALSGGGDSVGLLTALSRIRARRGRIDLDLAAATVDHGLRAGSHDEAVAAGHLSAGLGVPHAILDWMGEKPRTGVQAAAREARYGLLARHALDIGAELILTGHNLDDNIETHRMRLLRNTDRDAHGMAEAVLLFGKVWAARPLLGVRREAIRDYLRRCEATWAEDPSNANPMFERARLRHAPAATPPPDFPALMSGRKARLDAAAALLRDRARVVGLKVGVVDIAGLSPIDPTLHDAVGALAAILGGREHPPGDEGRRAMARLFGQEQGQMTMGRVVFDKRGNRLYLQREKRGLPICVASPGRPVIWDDRFRIVHETDQDLLIGPGLDGAFIIDVAPFDDLPRRVRQLALATGPSFRPSGANRPEITAILPGCDKFLPLERLDLGNVLAKIMGLPHFPSPVFRQQA